LDFVIWVEFLSEFTKSTSYGFRRFFDSSEIRASKNGITAATSSGEEDVVMTASWQDCEPCGGNARSVPAPVFHAAAEQLKTLNGVIRTNRVCVPKHQQRSQL
jgi:hypothetical protein